MLDWLMVSLIEIYLNVDSKETQYIFVLYFSPTHFNWSLRVVMSTHLQFTTTDTRWVGLASGELNLLYVHLVFYYFLTK